MEAVAWTGDDLRAWRARLRWTQARAAGSLLFDVTDYKKLERGVKRVIPWIRKLALLVERDHVRSMHVISGDRQVFATAERAAERMEALERDGALTGAGGRRSLRAMLALGAESDINTAIHAAGLALVRQGMDVGCRCGRDAAARLGDDETDLAALAVRLQREAEGRGPL